MRTNDRKDHFIYQLPFAKTSIFQIKVQINLYISVKPFFTNHLRCICAIKRHIWLININLVDRVIK